MSTWNSGEQRVAVLNNYAGCNCCTQINVDVFSVSLDACYAHQRFSEECNLPFPLLSDTRGRITDQYGLAYDEWEHHEGVPKRAPLTIDESRSVRYKWETEDAYESPSMDALHQTVLSLEEADS